MTISKEEFNERMKNANYIKILGDRMFHIAGTIDKIKKKDFDLNKVYRENGQTGIGSTHKGYKDFFIFVTDKYAEKNMDKFACEERKR